LTRAGPASEPFPGNGCRPFFCTPKLSPARASGAASSRTASVQLLGGEKPYREFTFERFTVTPGNQSAFERSKHFNPVADNLYLWGPCGVGKTHLAYAAARQCFEETVLVTLLPAYRLGRKVRMRDPDQEQSAIDQFVQAEVLVLDDLGAGPETVFCRQVLQEILEGRDFNDRAGLLVTSKYSLDELAAKLADDSIPSRLVGMCRVVEIKGHDRRLDRRNAANPTVSATGEH